MDCTAAQETLSAHLDQESGEDDVDVANGHLGTCAECRIWWADVGRVNRLLRVRTAEVIPDLATKVLAGTQPTRARRREIVRFSLAVVALTELTLAIPGLFAGIGARSIHDARHVGTLATGVALALLYVAWRPLRAFGLLPIVGALAVTLAVASAIDIATGATTAPAEAHHLLELTGLSMVWALAGFPLPQRVAHWRSRFHERRATPLHNI